MRLAIELDRETDGRWIAGVPELPGVVAHGATRAEAIGHVQAHALRVLAERIETGEPMSGVSFVEEDADSIAFEGTAEDAIRLLEGEHADETIHALRAEGLLRGERRAG